jgi:RNA polymerase sigma factor (sigma-70 family)
MPKATSTTRHDGLSVQDRQDLVLEAMPHIKEAAARIMRQHPWCKVGTSVEDMEQEGVVGAMLAAAGFDPSKGIKFWSFASRRVEGRMIDLFRDKNYLYLHNLILRGMLPDLDKFFGPKTADPESLWAQENMEHDSHNRLVHQVLETLSERNQQILKGYFFEEKSHPALAQTTGLGKSQVNNLHHESLETVRRRLECRGLTAETFFTKGSTQNALCQ